MNSFGISASASGKGRSDKLNSKISKGLHSGLSGKESVVVAINAGKEITRYALEWALSNVVHAGDRITLVALLQGGKLGSRRLWGLPRLAGDCANRGSKAGRPRNAKEVEDEVTESCCNAMQHLQKLCDSKQVKLKVKVISGASKGAVAMEAQSVGATWVVLDSQVKKDEGKLCMERLQCNLVIVKRSDAKILHLNLRASMESGRDMAQQTTSTNAFSECASLGSKGCDDIHEGDTISNHASIHGKLGYTVSEEGASSSPEVRTPFTATDKGTSSATSSEPGTSPFSSIEVVKTCTDHRDNDAPVVESDLGSDYGLVDAISDDDSSNDESCGDVAACRLLCRTTNASPEHRTHGSGVRYVEASDVAQPLQDFNSQRDAYQADPWMLSAKVRSNSANATPKVSTHNGRVSTPASPLGSSKRFSGNSRLSFSMREGGSGLHQVNPSLDASKGNAVSHQRHYNKHLVSSARQNSNGVVPFELDKATWSKKVLTTQDLIDKFSRWDQDGPETGDDILHKNGDLERTSSVRRAMSLSRHAPPGPPPLCSICQHKAPVFGKPPRRFMYTELELATGGFSQANFLAEGGFGSVHRGVLPDGQAVAVKQHKLASSQGDVEFCSEVEVLSCAQHRNVVMLIGYCIEDKRRLLVYEFICNGSLDTHLYGRDKECLEWAARQKIAVGAARGLRYLHEECRVGCIVHRDMRPNNILLTHDYEPMVGDFGLARWQPDGDLGVQTRVIGTFGYLAPEYAQSGQITEKADVYSFGVVLLELATGRKAVDLNRPKGQQCLTEWARPLLEENATHDLIDPLLDGNYSDYEAYCMLHAASLCVRRDPQLRPRMSQVLRILEGDVVIDQGIISMPSFGSKLAYDVSAYGGSRSSRMFNEYVINRAMAPSPLVSYSGSLAMDSAAGRSSATLCRDPLVACQNNGKLSYEALKAAYKGRGNAGRLSYEDL
ncbi:hypothetical protein GOP47_0022463 [Adiantum capillus-veneris]|uniref:Protein kinase domain-containing protein n=1 Tax=Adiantum capillus-veneris TaxID=13818 RepID=A0A9D4U5D7_ADICA|nr:hypothetical protein GOP47_0022463 [Adiantum capillus-veneris]